jgi:nitrogen fixation NifU-like protein
VNRYNQKIINLAKKPKNVGSMNKDDPDVGFAMIGSPACGDLIQLFVRIKNRRILDAKFKVFGCGSAISAASLMTQKLIGNTLSVAKKIKDKQISDELRLPPIKFHCSVLAETAIREAIRNYLDKKAGV